MSASFETPMNASPTPTATHDSSFMDTWTTEFTAPDALRRATASPKITAVIPAMNEAENLPHVLGRLPEMIDEVILVDGHSVDDTVAVARRIRPDIRVVTQNARGKGNALACGFAVATGDIIVMLDADGSTDPAEIPLFVSKLREGADFVKGSRYMTGGGSEDLTFLRRFGNTFLTGTVNALYRVDYTDLCYGYMAFWSRCLPDLNVDCSGFEVETLLTLRAAGADLKIAEVPSVERDRIHGESNLRPVRDGLRVMRTIMQERFGRKNSGRSWHDISNELAHHHRNNSTYDPTMGAHRLEQVI
jgi:glycosyltransferase involved in cell wall biosynthesis